VIAHVRTLARHPVLWMIAGSWLFRLVLIARGGLFHYPDEWRYYRAVEWLHRVLHGEGREAMTDLFEQSGHLGFVFLSLFPAAMQGAFRAFVGWPAETTMPLAAAFLALIAAGNIGWVYALARRGGAGRNEALLAAAFACASLSLTRHSRHFFPYDLSLFIGLGALWLGMAPSRSALRSIAVGCLSWWTFMVYNGYWPLAVFVALVHGFWGKPSLSLLLHRGFFGCMGFIVTPLALEALAQTLGVSFFAGLSEHSGSLVNGLYSEGWWLGWAYLWASEKGLLVVWALGTLLVVIATCRRMATSRVSLLWIAAIMWVYACHVLGATVFEKWLVFGRLARQLIPFLCLASAAGFSWMCSRRTKPLPWPGLTKNALFFLLVIHTLWNFSHLFTQRFPGDVLRDALEHYPDHLSVALSVTGTELHVDDELLRPKRYVLINHRILNHITGERTVPTGKIILHYAHPAQAHYDQYNGFLPRDRALARSLDISIRLIDTQASHDISH